MQGALLHSVMEEQSFLCAPADMQGGMDVRAAPIHDLNQFVPVLHFLKRHVLDRRTGDDQPVILFIPNIIKGLVKGEKMILGRILGMIGFGLNQIDLDLDRRIGQAAQDLRFCDDLERHQVKQRNMQWPDVLCGGAVLGHDENVFTLENGTRRQTVGYFDRQADTPFIICKFL